MTLRRSIAGIIVSALLCALPQLAAAQAPMLTPADPQPDAATLKAGLRVDYAYPADIRYLREAESWRQYGVKEGPPLIGFDYADTLPGEKALTSESAEYVIAFIEGYIAFPEAGTYNLEFWSNDGLRVEIGGVLVYEHDGRHPCETLGPKAFQVPKAGWYPVKSLFFQRRSTSCLLMKWQPPGGELDWAPVDIYGFMPQ